MTTGSGTAHVFGDHIDTDVIIAGRHLGSTEPAYLAKHCLETVRPDFAASVSSGDILVAGTNFGCGSSREHAAIAIKATGIAGIVCASAASIFYRSAINIALPVLLSPEAVAAARPGSLVRFDCVTGRVHVDEVPFETDPMPGHLIDILSHGGLLAQMRERFVRERRARLETAAAAP